MDRSWWNTHREEASKVFQGEFATSIKIQSVKQFNIRASNSGAGAVVLAKLLGANRAILVGVDCQHDGKKTHWHGDHPKHLANAANAHKFAAQFDKIKQYIGDMDVVNCSRVTALESFRKSRLEDELHYT